MNKKISFSVLGLVTVLVLIGLFSENILLMVHALLILFIHNIAYALTNVKNHIVFLMFNVTFFIFLLGRIFVSYYLGYNPNMTPIGLDFSDNTLLIDVLFILNISLGSYYISYFIADSNMPKLDLLAKLHLDSGLDNKVDIIKKYSFYLMAGTFIFRLLNLIDIFVFVRNNGYTSYYISYQAMIPPFVGIIGSLFAIAFFIHISTLKNLKDAIVPTGLYFIEGFVSLLTGQRNMFALNILIIIVYLILISDEISLTKLSKKTMILSGGVIIAIPLLFILVGNIRWGIESNQSVGQSIQRLFFDQGVTANLIGYTRILKESIPENRFYSLGAVIRFMKRIGSLFFDINTYSGQTVEHALNGHSFTYTITYLIMPDSFIQGRGYGSTYIAELLNDFNYIGVVAGNFFYGVFTKLLMVTQESTLFVKAFGLLIIRHFLFTPRAGFLDFFTYVFSPLNLVFVSIFILVIYKDELFLYLKSKRGLNENN